MLLPVNSAEFNASIKTAIDCEPVNEYNENKDAAPVQKIDKKTGQPVWSIQCVYRHAEDYANDFVTIKMPYASDPRITAAPIQFGGVKSRTWNMKDGKAGITIQADSFTQDIKPAAKTVAPPKPPADKK